MPVTITIRFYEELNDFLPKYRKKQAFEHNFSGNMTIKDIVESLGVPHTEIDMILANGNSVDFNYKPSRNDFISVYPVFESFNIKEVTRLRPEPLRKIRFILDVHLGKLVRDLRMLGFDSLYRNDYDDQEIIDIARDEKRIILTRDIGILKNKAVTHGYWVRSQKPKEQLTEVVDHFDLKANIKPLNRCIECNGTIMKVEKEKIINQLKPKTCLFFNEFFQCRNCKRIYWEGSHYQKMISRINSILNSINNH